MKSTRVYVPTITSGLVCSMLGFVLLAFSPMNTNAAPPRKDICPAPKISAKRNAAVKRACKYFSQVPQGWGLHSAFNRRGKVITCIHFTCRTAPRVLIPRK